MSIDPSSTRVVHERIGRLTSFSHVVRSMASRRLSIRQDCSEHIVPAGVLVRLRVHGPLQVQTSGASGIGAVLIG